jgi:hypothetical protein
VRRTGVRQDDGAESAAGRAELECDRIGGHAAGNHERDPAATIVTIKRFSPGKGGARLTANAQSSRARSLSQRCGPPQLVRDELWTLRDQCFESFAHLDLR